MKPKRSLKKLILKKDTIANLNLGKMRTLRAGEPPATSVYEPCCETVTVPYSNDDDGCTRMCLETVFDTCHSECISTLFTCDFMTCLC